MLELLDNDEDQILMLMSVLRSPRHLFASPRRNVTILLMVVVVAGAGMWCLRQLKPRHEFRQLLHSSHDVELSSLIIMVEEDPVTIDDADSIRYLTVAFRKASRKDYQHGATYYALVNLGSCVSVKCAIEVPDDPKTITIVFPLDGLLDGSEHYYGITLPDPMPDGLAKVLGRLR